MGEADEKAANQADDDGEGDDRELRTAKSRSVGFARSSAVTATVEIVSRIGMQRQCRLQAAATATPRWSVKRREVFMVWASRLQGGTGRGNSNAPHHRLAEASHNCPREGKSTERVVFLKMKRG